MRAILLGQRHGGQLQRFALEEADDPGRPAPAASYMLDDGRSPQLLTVIMQRFDGYAALDGGFA